MSLTERIREKLNKMYVDYQQPDHILMDESHISLLAQEMFLDKYIDPKMYVWGSFHGLLIIWDERVKGFKIKEMS